MSKQMALQFVLKYLRDRGYTESFLSLENQSKTNLRDYPKQIQFLRKILMKGDFNEAVQFLWTFQHKIQDGTLKKLTLQIYKQKLYELLQNPEELELRNLFEREVINVCTEDQYQSLFTLLTSRTVKELPGMSTWSPIKGRYSCFEKIEPHLSGFFNLTQNQLSNQFDCPLEQIIQSYLISVQKTEIRREQSPCRQTGGVKRSSTDKQEKQSIQIRAGQSKLDSSKDIKIDNFISSFNNKKDSIQKNKMQTPHNKQGECSMAEEKVNKSNLNYKNEVKNEVYSSRNEKLQSNVMRDSYFNKKQNPYSTQQTQLPIYGLRESRLPQYTRSLKIQDGEVDQKRKQLKQRQDLQQVQDIRNRTNDKQRHRQREIKQQLISSYLNEFQKQVSDSEVYQEEVRRNIAYLDQNNSVIYKEDDNQNFTFSNGAEESALHDKNRRVLKLATFSDPKAIRTCQFSPTSSLFAIGTNSSYLKIYDVEELLDSSEPMQLEPVCQIPQLHSKSIFCLDWSANQKAIATCSNDLTIKITQFNELYMDANYKTNVIGRHESCIRMTKFTSLSNRVVSCGDDSLLKVWDVGKIKKCTNLKGHTQSISAFRFCPSGDQNVLFSVSKDCTVRKWDLRTAQAVTVSEAVTSELTFIADNIDRIVVSHKNGWVSFLNPSLQIEQSVQIHEQEIRSIDGTSYDDLLLTASFDGHISIFSQKGADSPSYHQHNESSEDKVVYATFINHPHRRGFASTSTLGLCNIYSFQ